MAKNKKRDLGKGLGALLSSFDNSASPLPPTPKPEKEISKDDVVEKIALEKIEVNPHQPRKHFAPEALQELSESLKMHGLIQPITVRRMGDGNFQLISGERRLRASKLAGLTEIPAYVIQADDKAMQEMALIENLQREDLSPMEVASTYKLLMDKYNLRQEDLAQRVGKSRVAVTQILGLLTLPPTVIDALNNQEISRGHAIKLAQTKDASLQLILLRRIVAEKLSVRALEQIIKSLNEPSTSAKPVTPSLPLEYQKVQENLKDFFEAKVQLKLKDEQKGKGQIVIPFDSVKEMNRLLALLEEQ